MPREKPATTIRLLRRQLSIAQATVSALQLDRTDKERVIAGYDVQLSEALDEITRWQLTAEGQAKEFAKLQAESRRCAERLAYLEGYHAKSQETAAARPISATVASLAGDPAETDAGGYSRHSQSFSVGHLDGAEGGEIRHQTRNPPSAREQIRRERPYDPINPLGQKVEHVEIKDGRDEPFRPPGDGRKSWIA